MIVMEVKRSIECDLCQRFSNTICNIAFLQACQESGIPTRIIMGKINWVQVYFQFIKPSRRQSTAVAFLKPVMHRPNLIVVTEARATQILIESDRAVGVSYQKFGSRKSLCLEGSHFISGDFSITPNTYVVRNWSERC